MDFSQILAAQLLTNHSRKHRATQEEAFYQAHGTFLFLKRLQRFGRSFRTKRANKAPTKEVLFRPVVQNVS